MDEVNDLNNDVVVDEIPAEKFEYSKDEIDALLAKAAQSEADKVRTEYSKKLKDAEKAKQLLEREKMSDEERKTIEIEDFKAQLEEKERFLKQRELQIHAIDTLKENELPIEFKQFLTGASEEFTGENIKAFKQLWAAEMQKAVQDKFKESGRSIQQSTGSAGVTKEQFAVMNYNERAQLMTSNPELYKQLKD